MRRFFCSLSKRNATAFEIEALVSMSDMATNWKFCLQKWQITKMANRFFLYLCRWDLNKLLRQNKVTRPVVMKVPDIYESEMRQYSTYFWTAGTNKRSN